MRSVAFHPLLSQAFGPWKASKAHKTALIASNEPLPKGKWKIFLPLVMTGKRPQDMFYFYSKGLMYKRDGFKNGTSAQTFPRKKHKKASLLQHCTNSQDEEQASPGELEKVGIIFLGVFGRGWVALWMILNSLLWWFMPFKYLKEPLSSYHILANDMVISQKQTINSHCGCWGVLGRISKVCLLVCCPHSPLQAAPPTRRPLAVAAPPPSWASHAHHWHGAGAARRYKPQGEWQMARVRLGGFHWGEPSSLFGLVWL